MKYLNLIYIRGVVGEVGLHGRLYRPLHVLGDNAQEHLHAKG